VPDEGEIAIEDLIANEGVIITLTHNGLIKRTNVSSYRAQRRGGKGVIGMPPARRHARGEDDDFIEHLFTASTHDYLMFFTNTGVLRGARARDPRHGPRRQGPQHRQPAGTQAEARRSPRSSASAKTAQQGGHHLAAARLSVLRHPAGHGQEDALRFCNVRKGGIIAITSSPATPSST
jgi:DNA gyrase subunit A